MNRCLKIKTTGDQFVYLNTDYIVSIEDEGPTLCLIRTTVGDYRIPYDYEYVTRAVRRESSTSYISVKQEGEPYGE
jgi:hypothetical protein